MFRRWLFLALVCAFILLVVTQFDTLLHLGRTLSQGQPIWIGTAIGLIGLYNLGFARSYQACFRAAEVKLRYRDVMAVMLATLFVGAAAPGGGAAGMVLYVDDAVRRGYSAARATVGLWLQLITDFTTLTAVSGIGLIYLQQRGQLNGYTLVGAGGLLLITVCLVGALALGWRRPAGLRRVLHGLRWLANRPAAWLTAAGRPCREFLDVAWVERSTDEFTAAAGAAASHPQPLLLAGLVMTMVNVVDLLTFNALFHAFGHPIGLGTLVAGFSMAAVAMAISPAPQGIGVVEGTLLAVFAGLGVPWPVNLAVSLSYRGLAFWLPTAIGFLLLRRLKLFYGD